MNTIARYAADSGWARVRPPLIALTAEQHSSLKRQLDAAGFAMSGLQR